MEKYIFDLHNIGEVYFGGVRHKRAFAGSQDADPLSDESRDALTSSWQNFPWLNFGMPSLWQINVKYSLGSVY